MKKIAIVLLCLGLYSCGSDKGLAQLKALCEIDAGVEIYKTVEANGYYDAYTNCHHCWQDLIKSNYQFVEFCTKDNRDPLVYSIVDAGCYRVSKVHRDNSVCHLEIDKKINNKAVEPYIDFRKNHCISVEKIDKPEAKYSYHSDFKKWKSENGNSEYTKSYVYLMDRIEDKILGTYINYSFNKNPGHTTAKSCDIFGDEYSSFLDADLINSVFKQGARND